MATDIVADFVKLRRDVVSGTLERASAGKFVESFVQCLQEISTGRHSEAPKVDDYLKNRVESKTTLPDGLRLCGSRIARSIYTLRNKRSIAHKGEIDPNTIDLEFTYHGAAWIMAELVRCATGVSMEEAGAVIRLLRAPIGALVEELDGVRIVHAKVSTRVEILLLLHNEHPEPVTTAQLAKWSDKDAASTRARLSELRKARLIASNGDRGYKLTRTGHRAATEEIQRLQT